MSDDIFKQALALTEEAVDAMTSDTPRTDAHLRAPRERITNQRFDTLWELARQLERELTQARYETAMKFANIRDAIADRMAGHTIHASWDESWRTFLALLRAVQMNECAYAETLKEGK